ncbi:MAG: HAD family hydrolase [Candidatus Woesearchaeota archaeon]
MVKVISFDLDGTLVSEDIDNWLWNEEIPRLYGLRNSISFEDAKKEVFAKYYEELHIKKNKRWFEVEFWFELFELSIDTFEEDFKKKVNILPDVLDTLSYLSSKYKLVIISNAGHQFMTKKLNLTNLNKYFYNIFSAEKYSNTKKKDEETFVKIASLLGVKPVDMVHIGDSPLYDKDIPESVGVKSYLLDTNGNGDISSLKELKDIF